MKTNWTNIVLKITISLVAEVILTVLGLDDLADYNDFIFEQKMMATRRHFERAAAIQPNFCWLAQRVFFQM